MQSNLDVRRIRESRYSKRVRRRLIGVKFAYAAVLVAFVLPPILNAQTALITPSVRKTADAGHSVEAIAFSSDGRWLAIGTRTGDVGLLDLNTPLGPLWLDHRKKRVNAIAFARNGKTLAVAGDDGIVTLIQVPDGKPQDLTRRGGHKIFALAFSPDNEQVASAGDDKAITLWSVTARDELFQIEREAGKRVVYLGFTSQGLSLICADESGIVSEFDVKNRTQLRQFQDSDKSIGSAAESYSGEYIAMGTLWSGLQKSSDGGSTVAIAPSNTSDDSTPRDVLRSPLAGLNSSSVIRPTDLYRESRIKLYDTNRLSVVKTLDGINGTVVSISLSADDRFVAIARERISESYLSIYDTLRNAEVVSFPSTGNVRTVAFSGDGHMLASATDAGLVTIYAVKGIVPGRSIGDLQGTKYSVTTSQSEPLLGADAKLTVGITDFEALQVDQEVADIVAQLLRTRMVANSKITLLDRTKMLQIIREQNIQNSNRFDNGTAAQIGKILGAQKMIFGSVSKLGTSMIIHTEMVDVVSGKTDGSCEVICRDCSKEDLPEAVAALKPALVADTK